jgi:hypothetical protein
LAPDIIEALLDGRQHVSLGLPQLLEPFPMEWVMQCKALANVECRLPDRQQHAGRQALPGNGQWREAVSPTGRSQRPRLAGELQLSPCCGRIRNFSPVARRQ